jgi:tetratricopeptide (TPR) repeat protein
LHASHAPDSRTFSPLENPVGSEGVSARPSGRTRARPAEGPIRLSREKSGIDPRLESAYDLLRAGEFDEAILHYEAVLRSDRENIDALLGIAAIAGKSGQRERAAAYYRRILEIDSSHPAALAGLINERDKADPTLSEKRLRDALAARPDSPALLFSLGNLYARQNRWNAARQAYFNAYSVDPGNADHAFNLAVSLDHLNQTSLAVRYYEAAVKTALENSRAFAFDIAQATNRVLELTSFPDNRTVPP